MIVFKPHKDLYKYFTKEERTRWAKYLRETDLVQCSGAMSKGEGTACCLMVWEVYEQGGDWFEPLHKRGSGRVAEVPSVMENNTMLKSGVLPQNVIIAYLDEDYSIGPADLNDTYGFTFNEIADILEGKDVIKIT